MEFLKKVKGRYEVKGFLKVEVRRGKGRTKTKTYTIRKRFYDEREFRKFLETGKADYWRITATQMRSILNLTSTEDWLYRFIDKDPGLGGDRSDPDFRPMTRYDLERVLDFISKPMDGWEGINFVRNGEYVFDIWYIKWSHLLKPQFPVRLEVPLNQIKACLLAETL
ncbi:hypothetical protein Ferp_0568 [Ferroglobus placidus DSM 10642]|uniref:Uncharacterized protein n=1 Tax=Ferroglobus placidus (strain DSM 10642 / AEDII12DO) TaxID=589924 RepID=D3S3A8_FERPA|nr:hypothetical protein [Ferroglobus placidus]ADC64741.1 hypothetical protein Ferp_0568 [Ferroglobus placidus DSM 10642]